MSIEFACPECRAKLRGTDRDSGRQTRCPACQAICDVPAAFRAGARIDLGALPSHKPQMPS